MQFFLNSEPLSTHTCFGVLCADIVYLYRYDTWADILSMLGTSTISNQPVEDYVKFIAVSINYIGNPLTLSLFFVTLYGSIRYISTLAHGSIFADLADSSLYLRLLAFLNLWYALQCLTIFTVWVTSLD